MHTLAKERDARARLSKQHVSGSVLKAHAPFTAPGQPVCACGGGCPRCRDGGAPFSAAVRAPVEAIQETDFSGVRLHPEASEVTASLRARAVTLGQDIYFHPGQFRPETPDGQRLIAHELAHTRQTRGSENAAGPAPLRVSQPGDALERNADALAHGTTKQALAAPAGAALRTPIDNEEAEDTVRPEAGEPEPTTMLGLPMSSWGEWIGRPFSWAKGWVRPPPAPVPGLTASQTTRFFSDLNAALTRVLGVSTSLGPADFSIQAGPEYAATIKRDPSLRGRYASTQQVTNRMCAARTPAALKAAGYTDPVEIREIRGYQANRRFCRGAQATDELIAWYLTVKGFTPPGGGPSVVSAAQFQNNILDTLVHEGVHRSEGAIWKQRSRPGFYSSRTHGVIAYIGKTLDEGATQIITELVIGEMQKVRGRSWFRGYTSTAYATEAKEVRDLLADKGKDVGFLKRAYKEQTRVNDVEDLQSWQKTSWP